ncbi:hypothetical protein [Bacillus kexueae]|uniref:hypothetical protein n=1 Tax=Aeribacillus kexueae TaxID=2078952 RepID=UPI001FAF7841|nr:hypothetical protein [Bacillus kexueae]
MMNRINKLFLGVIILLLVVNSSSLSFIVSIERFGSVFGLIMYYFLCTFCLVLWSIMESPNLSRYSKRLLHVLCVVPLFLPIYYATVGQALFRVIFFN